MTELAAILEKSGITADVYSGGMLSVTSPIDGAEIARLHETPMEAVPGIIAKAKDAFKTWRDTPAPVRGELVRLWGKELRAAKADIGLWRQIAGRYADAPQNVVFEILNEPKDRLTGAAWVDLQAAALAVIRESNPDRLVITGPPNNCVCELEGYDLPKDDNIVLSYHHYLPVTFTHQGADWVDGSQAWLGTTWEGTEQDKALVLEELDTAEAFARQHQVPVYAGEFGVLDTADMTSRVRWTGFLRQEFERRGRSWAYCDFRANFGAFDPHAGSWNEILKALVPERRASLSPVLQ